MVIKMEKEAVHKPDILKKLKEGKKLGKDQFIIFILAGILLLIIALPTSTNSGKKPEKSGILDSSSGKMEVTETAAGEEKIESDYKKTETEEYESYLENKLEQVISMMEGAGKVKVTVTISTSSEKVVEKDMPTVRNNTSENDAEGGVRNVNEVDCREETVYIKDSDGSSSPYVVKTIQPLIEGVVVVAQGADRPEVSKNITEAIVALFDMEPHKIKVVKMKSE